LVKRTPFFRAPLAFIVHADQSLVRALESTLEPKGYRVVSMATGKEVLERAPAVAADLILLDANLPDQDSIRVCQALRQNPAIARNLPILILTWAPATKQQRLAALRAGAWEYLKLPLDSEELELKLDTYVRVKLEADRAMEESAVDLGSGLYTTRGLERRARELASDAFRRHAALACVALGIELEVDERRPAAADLPAALDYVAHLLHARGRTSDAIGRFSRSDFAVLAPATDAEGAARLAHRLAATIERERPKPEGLPPMRVRAGYEAVSDLAATPIQPQSLLEHAGVALQHARTAGDGERVLRYQAGAT
jgi:PleD family two-component response regulator